MNQRSFVVDNNLVMGMNKIGVTKTKIGPHQMSTGPLNMLGDKLEATNHRYASQQIR
jgi:hypothetical protein